MQKNSWELLPYITLARATSQGAGSKTSTKLQNSSPGGPRPGTRWCCGHNTEPPSPRFPSWTQGTLQLPQSSEGLGRGKHKLLPWVFHLLWMKGELERKGKEEFLLKSFEVLLGEVRAFNFSGWFNEIKRTVMDNSTHLILDIFLCI